MTFPPYPVVVRPEWVDYNHHLNEGYYAVIFGNASDHVLEHLGFGPAYREEEGGTFYTVETHIRFLREVSEGARLEVVSQVLGVDAKRLHLWHELGDGTGSVSATAETMLLHVDIAAGRVSPMSAGIEQAARREVSTSVPTHAGRGIKPAG
jgi:acyl-CoA thioester hydrolase